MADVTLSDYAGYIFLEIIKAREMADNYSRDLAKAYAKDEVLRYFSVPRFKVPKIEITIPVLISGARFKQVIRFNMQRKKFLAYINGRVQYVIGTVENARGELMTPPSRPVEAPFDPNKAIAVGTPINPRFVEFWQLLHANPDPSRPDSIVLKMWPSIVEQALNEKNLLEAYKKSNPNNELLNQTLRDILNTVSTNTVIDSTSIKSLLVNPETNVVKNGSSDSSVFTIKAEMLEEGFYIRQVKDDDTGATRPVVEFD